MNPEQLPVSRPEVSLLRDVDISRQLSLRSIGKLNRKGELAAMYHLANSFGEASVQVLSRLSKLAMELCSAGSAGVTVLEPSDAGEIFRWQALAGKIEPYVGGSTPRDWSPCGECLKAGRATLFSYPARYFTYLQTFDLPIVEGLVIPMYFQGRAIGTIWIVSHSATHGFDAEHVRIMTSLGTFAVTALRGQLTAFAGDSRESRDIVWEEYMRRVLLRDELALEALFEESYPLVFATALRIISYRADAEEIAADVYARVWMRALTFDEHRGSVASWLVKVTHNTAIDKLRARAVRTRSEAALLFHCSPLESPESAVDAAEKLDNLKHALARLPFEQRRAIELFYFSEMSLADIARELSQPIGTVKTRLRIGRLALRRLLAALAPSPSKTPTICRLTRKPIRPGRPLAEPLSA